VLRDDGRADEAETLFEEAIEILRESFGPQHADLGFVRAALSLLLARDGRALEAGDQARQALAIHDQTLATGLRWRRRYALELFAALEMVGRNDEAAEIRARYPLDLAHKSS
jgi:tetratricopeptide (TPR) repeat protein